MKIYSSDIFNESWPKLTGLYEEEEAKTITKWMLEDLWEITTTDLILNKGIPYANISTLEHYILRLMAGDPIQHVLGYAWFMGKKYFVDSNVLIPRQETEELVHLVITENPDFSGTILDIGTGSGIIPISLKARTAATAITGLDVSSMALSVAQKNARNHNTDVYWIQMDILREYPNTRYDLLISNPPYVLSKDKVVMHENVLGKDPDLALFVPDNDPLLFYRRICELSPLLLNSNGKIYFEIHEDFGAEVEELMLRHQLENVTIHQDLNGKDRIATGIKKPSSRLDGFTF
jgi:release factor glutamine methyltransferase